MLKYLVLLFFLVSLMTSCDDRDGLLFSDDFESYAEGSVPASPWEKSGDGRIFVDSSKSRSGKRSVHFVTGETYKNRAFLGLFDRKIFPLKKNRYYGRVYMYVEEASPDGVHWTMIQSSGRVPGRDFSSEIRYGGQHQKRLMANYETHGVRSDCWQHSKFEIPEKQWFLIDWFFDGRKGRMKVWIDDKPIEDIWVGRKGEGCIDDDLKGEWIYPLIENVQIGWVDYQPNGGERNVWFDDFMISAKPFDKSKK
ncbi:MAG: hypothetical protein R2747_20220 [Pyrinomonadaceae bacterium]